MTGCTPFLVNMMSSDDARLAKADPHKLASKYGVNVDWVKMCLDHWRNRGR